MRKGVKVFFAFMILISFSFLISANKEDYRCVDNGISFGFKDQQFIKQGEDYLFSIHPYNSSDGSPLSNATSFCAYHLYNSTGQHIIADNDIPFGSTPYDFFLFIDGNNFSANGIYPYVVTCFADDYSIGGTCSGTYNVSSNGEEVTYSYLIAMVVLILTFVGFGILIYKDKEKMSDEKYWSMMVKRWKDKNYLRFSATVIWYNVKKNSYILQYLIGLVIMIMVYDITLTYNLTAISPVFRILLALYTWGSLLVVIVFFGSIQEWIKEWQEELSKINWGGLANGK